jgi:carbon storage regulator
MLVLSRKANQSIMIGDDIRILVVGVDRDQVKLGIEAPRHVPVHRFEIFAEIHRASEAGSPSAKLAKVGKNGGGADSSALTDHNQNPRLQGEAPVDAVEC